MIPAPYVDQNLLKKKLANYGSKYEEDSEGRRVRRSRRNRGRSNRIVPQ